MLKWIFTAAGLIIAAGLFFAFKYGVAPRPIPLIKPTKVESLEEAGVLVVRRMRQDIIQNNVILAGSLPLFADYPLFWQGFVLGARDGGGKVDKVFFSEELSLFRESQVIPNEKASISQLKQMLEQTSSFSERILFYVPSTESSHLNPESFSKIFDKKKIKKISITLHPFQANKRNKYFESLKCENKEKSFLGQLDCLGKDVTLFGSRKDLESDQNYVALYRYGLSDYVAFWYRAMKKTTAKEN